MLRVTMIAGAVTLVSGHPLARGKHASLLPSNASDSEDTLKQFRILHSFPPAGLKSDKWWEEFNSRGIRVKSLGCASWCGGMAAKKGIVLACTSVSECKVSRSALSSRAPALYWQWW